MPGWRRPPHRGAASAGPPWRQAPISQVLIRGLAQARALNHWRSRSVVDPAPDLTNGPNPAASVLTLAVDARSLAHVQALRDRHFPPARNIVPAHLTLFHALPGAAEAAIRAALTDAATATPQLPLNGDGTALPWPRRRLRGCLPPLQARARALAERWRDMLTPQDSNPFKPHVTVQNKADPAEARRLLDDLRASFTPFAMTGVGLLLWRYLGGPWDKAGFFPFAPH